MSCRETRWILLSGLAFCGFMISMAAASVGAQENIPIEVQDVDLRTNQTTGTVVLRTEQPVEWSAEAGSRTLVLLLRRTVPGPEALDRSSRTGLVSLVEVGFAVPSGVPATRITVHSRKPFEYEVESSEVGLTIRLRTAETQTVSPVARRVTPSMPRTETPATDSEALEKALRESDLLRQRVAELHFDRLQLRESVDGARAELADQAGEIAVASTRASELELENRRLDARAQELSGRLEAAEKQAHAKKLMAENRLLSDELSAQQARFVESQEGAVRLRAKLDQLEGELSTARASVESKAGDSQAARERLAESGAREQALAERLRESRASTTVLRAWLSKAPEVLQASDFVVSPGDSCLPLRPEPSSKSAVLECLPVGSALEALSFRPEWLRVRTDGNREGWIRVERVMPPRPATPAIDTAAQAVLAEARSEAAGSKSRVAELERELEGARIDSREARAELEREQSRLSALRVEFDLGQATVLARADPCLTVRAAPGVDQSRLDCLPPGTAVSIDDATAGWLSVRTAAGISGWVASRFVQSGQAIEASERTSALERSQQMLEAQAGDLSSQLQEAKAEGELKEARLEDLEQQQTSAREQSEALAARVADLSAELADERNRLQQTSAKWQESEQALTALRSQQELERTEALGALEVTQVVVKEDVDPCLSFRQEPAVGSRVLECLLPGTQLATVALAGGWFRVRLEDGREGWSSGEFLESIEQRALRSLEARVADRDGKIVSLENRLAVAEGGEAEERQRLSRELATAQEEIGRLNTLAERSGEVPLLESALERVRGALGASEPRTQALEGQVAELEAARSSRASAAESDSDQLERQLAAVAADLGTAHESLAASEATNIGLAAQVAELEAARSSRASAEAESDDLERTVAGLQADLAAVRRSVLEGEARNRELEADALALAETRATLASVQGYNDELSRRLAAVEASAAGPAKLSETAKTSEEADVGEAVEPVKLAQVRQPLPPRDEAGSEAQAASVGPLRPLPSALPPSMTEETPAIAPAVARFVAPVVEITEPSAAIEVEDLPMTALPADIEAFARAWARAWSDQRVDDYLSFYGAAFVPRGGMSRDDWASTRRDRLTRPKFVVVEPSNFRTQIHGPDRATISFDQLYRSDTFQDRVVKTLELVREGDLWKIREEIAD